MTSIRHRFLIDECLSPDLIDAYLKPHCEVIGCTAELVHYIDKFGPNSAWKDPQFIQELSRDRRWVVLTGDKSGHSMDSMRMVCRQHGVTLVYAGSAVGRAGLEFYGPQFVVHWGGILAIADGPKGGQHALKMASQDRKRSVLVAVECPAGYEPKGAICVPTGESAVYDGAPESLSKKARRRRTKGA